VKNQASQSSAQLAAAAFPEEWSPEWTRWLQSLARASEVDAAALGPALGAALAALDGLLVEDLPAVGSGVGGERVVPRDSGSVAVGGGSVAVSEGGKEAEVAAASARNAWEQDGYEEEEEETRPSPDHPWMSVLTWPAPGGLPRTKNLKKGDYVLLLTQEAGRHRRGQVHVVHSARLGIVSVELCGGEGVVVFQISCVEYRTLTSSEVALIERTLGCGFMQLSPAEQQEQEELLLLHDRSPVEAVQATKGPAQSAERTLLHAGGGGGGRGSAPHLLAPSGNRGAECGKGGAEALVGGGGLGGRERSEFVDDAREDVLLHRKSLWDETGAPAERNMHDLKALRKKVDDAREARDDERMRDVTLRYA
jgi:hypothetical protein